MVVTLLQQMQKKVQDEGAAEAELYKKFQCYCQTGDSDLSASIGAAEDKIPAVSSNIEGAQAQLARAKSELKQAQSDRSDAKAAVAQATALREKEAAVYCKFKADHDANIAAIAKAVDAISKGTAGSFLQTPAAHVLEQVFLHGDFSETDQEAMTAFLSQSADYAPQSGEIIGILKQMGDTMAAALSDGTAAEKSSIESYDGLVKAKSAEMVALTATIEGKSKRIGQVGVDIVNMQEDLDDTQAALLQDKKFLADLDKSCATKKAEWEERSKTRAEELVALADTIKVLNDDDAPELFKSTLPSASASLLQIEESASAARARAVTTLRSAQHAASSQAKPAIDMLLLALTGKQASGAVDFGKVISMIDDMVKLLGQEQTDDDDKKAYCAQQLDQTDDQKKALENEIADGDSAIAAANEAIATLAKEMAALEAGIAALDKAVAEATAQRKDENAEYKALMSSNTAAKEVLGWANNRSNMFFYPKLYKPAPKTQLSAEDSIYSSLGGELTK